MIPIVCVMGPTAVGKSDLAVAAALRFGGEVVNADSMQVYRGIPIGTGAPAPRMLADVPHHLFGYRDLREAPDAGEFAREASAVISEIRSRGRIPVVVGGTFFWIRALFQGLSDIPEVPEDVRRAVLEEIRVRGAAAAHERLRGVDSATGLRLKPGDTQRIARALEVFDATGVPLSRFQERAMRPAVSGRILKLALSLPRSVLYGRIDARVDAMIAAGLVDEVRSVLASGLAPDSRPMRTTGYAPVVAHVLGEIDLGEMRRRVAQGHRNYAKRQETWLRKEPGVETFDAREPEAALGRIAEFLEERD
jgi:tRNA dimethylallyltransferase